MIDESPVKETPVEKATTVKKLDLEGETTLENASKGCSIKGPSVENSEHGKDEKSNTKTENLGEDIVEEKKLFHQKVKRLRVSSE